MNILGRWFDEHSLSISLFVGFFLCTVASAWVQQGTWLYDFWFMLAGSFGGSFLIVVLARFFWEKDSDPTKPSR